MSAQPDATYRSRITGKNAVLRLYPDRIEWEMESKVSGGKVLLGAMTAGLSLAATGVKTRKGAGVEMIPMRQITSVVTKRDSMLNDVVSIVAAGNTIDVRVPKSEAEEIRAYVLARLS
jgi:hypothetical protein